MVALKCLGLECCQYCFRYRKKSTKQFEKNYQNKITTLLTIFDSVVAVYFQLIGGAAASPDFVFLFA